VDISEVLDLWDGDTEAFARAVGISRKTVYAWVASGRVPESRKDGLEFRVIPRQREKLARMAEVNKALDKEFGRGLFDDGE
jgi:hypothetical protein